MGFIKKSAIVSDYNARQSTLLSDDGERRYAQNSIRGIGNSFSDATRYDIFLSHCYDDARVVAQIAHMFTALGLNVYVDWVEDAQLERQKVTAQNARVLRRRMDRCRSLIYLTSPAAAASVWMPWELGYMDARVGRIAVAPILKDDEEFDGREYLGLYPYLDLTAGSLYVHADPSTWVGIQRWLDGIDP